MFKMTERLQRHRLRQYLKTVVLLVLILDVLYFLTNSYGDQYLQQMTNSTAILDKGVGEDIYKSSVSDVEPPIIQTVAEGDSPSAESSLRLRSLFPAKICKDQGSRFITKKLLKFKNFDKFDRRLLPALWLHMINENIDSAGVIDRDFKLPFNWDLLNNIASRLTQEPYFKNVVQSKMKCKEFKELAPDNVPGTFLQHFCTNYDYEEPNFENDYRLPFKAVRKVDQYLTDVDWRRIFGMIHMLTQAEIPSNVLFMGLTASKRSLVVPLDQVSNGVNDLTMKNTPNLKNYYSTMVDNLIQSEIAGSKGQISKDEALSRGVSLYQEYLQLNKRLQDAGGQEVIPFTKPVSAQIIGKGSVPLDEALAKPLELDESLFQWYLPDEVNLLKNQIKANKKQGNNVDQLRHLKQWGDLILDPDFKQPWYYGIPSIQGRMLDHYDWRFFHDVTYEEDKELHVNVLHRLARTWFKLCQEFEVPSWLNHGSLIGWYWNAASMPYDGDLDLQLPIQSLHKLSKALNNTLIYDFTDDLTYVNDEWQIDNRAELGIRSYLFDVDPMYLDRNGINSGENNIDARLIDTETGLYIDLTALADFHSETKYDLAIQKQYLEKTGWTHTRVVIPPHLGEFFDETTGNFNRDQGKSQKILEDLIKEIDEAIKNGIKKSTSVSSPTKNLYHDFVHCKHFHTYNLHELFPLIPTYFENTLSYLPGNWYRNILIDYGSADALNNDYYNHNKFWPSVNLWIDYDECPVWDRKSGKPTKGATEQDVIVECMDRSPLIAKDIKTSAYYGLQHQQFRRKVMPTKPGTAVSYNYADELKPILEKFQPWHPLKSEPFVNRYLY